MNEIERLVAANGGVVSARQLVEAGMSRQAIRRNDRLQQLRHGWYAVEGADQAVVRAVTNGGALACVSVLRRAGVWTMPDASMHVRYSEHLRKSARNCRPFKRRYPAVRTAIDSLELALESAASCLDPEGAVVAFDSMLNKEMVELADIRTIAQASRHRSLDLAARCDSNAESGIETLTRLRLHSHGVELTSQVCIGSVGRVDFLIGKRLVIECDGEAYHGDKFESDRKRDRILVAMGYLVIRLTYKQVMFEWNAALEDILAVIRRRDHLRSPKIAA